MIKVGSTVKESLGSEQSINQHIGISAYIRLVYWYITVSAGVMVLKTAQHSIYKIHKIHKICSKKLYSIVHTSLCDES